MGSPMKQAYSKVRCLLEKMASKRLEHKQRFIYNFK